MADRKRLNISMSFDDKYAKYAYVTILSLFENNRDSIIYLYVLHKDLESATQKAIADLCAEYDNVVQFIYVDPARIVGKLPFTECWSIEVYFRLLLSELLSEDVDRVINLDGDMIINHSIRDLYDTQLDDYDIAACYDICLEKSTLEKFMKARHSFFEKLFNDKTYINAGMLLINLKRMRSLYSFDTYLDAYDKLEGKAFAQDQDLINYVHEKTIKHLDPHAYNFPGYMAYYEYGGYEEAREKVTIIHYIGTKPWQGGNHIHYDTEAIWWEYALRTPYANELMRDYILQSVLDPTVENMLQEQVDEINTLGMENVGLKQELQKAMDQVKKVIEMFSDKKG